MKFAPIPTRNIAKINGNEIIFLPGLQERDLDIIRSSSKIPVTRPTDIWELICEDVLDTSFSTEMEEETFDVLEKSGVDRTEVKQIRKRLRIRMLARAYATLEWQYYGQSEVLEDLWPLTEKKYWWSMDVALGNGKRVQ